MQDVYYAYRSSSLERQQWGQSIDAYFGLLVRQDQSVADELRLSLLEFSRAILQ